MTEYNKVSPEFIDGLRAIVGEQYVYTDGETLDKYKTDEETDERCFHLPDVVIAPASAEEIAAVMKLCNEYVIPVTVRGGGSGIVDGAIATMGGLIILMERLNKIIELNKEGMYLVAQAGVRTIDIQKLANEEGFLYAGDPCSAESCQIGGNLATNAGGNKAVRYGVTRNQVYAYAYAQGGRLAGEHGIGAKKLSYMEEFTPRGELELMRKIKRAWDPNNILNPGKIFNA